MGLVGSLRCDATALGAATQLPDEARAYALELIPAAVHAKRLPMPQQRGSVCPPKCRKQKELLCHHVLGTKLAIFIYLIPMFIERKTSGAEKLYNYKITSSGFQ